MGYQAFFQNITSHCNQQCPFCYAGWSAQRSHKSLERISLELARAREVSDCRDIVVSGGEPTTHPDLLEILQLAGGLGFSRVTLFTNGQRLRHRDLVTALVKGGLSSALVSLHGSRPEVHDRLVGRRHFSDVLVGLDRLLAAGVEIIINTVVTTANLDDIGSIHQLVQDRFPTTSTHRLTYPAVMGEISRRLELLPTYDQVTARINSLLNRPGRVPLSCELIPLCLLGPNLETATEYHFSGDEYLILDGRNGINRIGGKPCLKCPYLNRCNGLQLDPVRLHGVPESYGRIYGPPSGPPLLISDCGGRARGRGIKGVG
jgi:pyruvate-formate lyase-activating enzyme